MWDLSSQTRDWTHIPFVGRQILNHWTTRELPAMYLNSFLPALLQPSWVTISVKPFEPPPQQLLLCSLHSIHILSVVLIILHCSCLLSCISPSVNLILLSILIHLYFPSTVSVTSTSVWEVTMVRWLCLSSCWSFIVLVSVSCLCCLPGSVPLDTEKKHILCCLVESGKHWWHGVIHATCEL